VAAVVRALQQAAAGRRSLLLLVGPAGIGKSRVLAEAIDAVPGFDRFDLLATPYDLASAYAAARPALRARLGADPTAWRAALGADADLAPLLSLPLGVPLPPTPAVTALDPQFVAPTRDRLLARLLTEQAIAPLLVVAEDAQYLDRASLGLLDALAATPPATAVAVIAALRDSLREGESLDAWPGDPTRWFTLAVEPLGEAETRALALSLTDEAPLDDIRLQQLLAGAAGNPLFLQELALVSTTEDAELPATAEGVLAARIDGLPPAQRRRLRAAAVVGSDQSLDVMAEATGDTAAGRPESWTALADFVTLTDGRVRFSHDLVRRAAYEGLTVRRRRVIHGALVDLLTAQLAPAATIAVHAEAAERWDEAADLSAKAGKDAAAAGAWADALESFRRAWRCGLEARLGDLWLADVANMRGLAASFSGRLAEAEEAYRHAADRSPAEERPRHLTEVAHAVARLGHGGEALNVLDAAEQGVHPADRRWPGIALRRSIVLHRMHRLTESLELALKVGESGVATPAERARAWLRAEMSASESGDPNAGEFGKRALRAFDEIPGDPELPLLLVNLGISAVESYDWKRAQSLYENAIAAARRSGDVGAMAGAQINYGELLSDRGADIEAQKAFEEARRVCRAGGYALLVAHAASGLGRVCGRLGDLERARRLLDEAETGFTALNMPSSLAEVLVRRVELAVSSGRSDAQALLDAADEVLKALQSSPRELAAALHRSRAAHTWLIGDSARASAILEAAVDAARRADSPYEEGLAIAMALGMGLHDARSVRAQAARRDEIAIRLGVRSWPLPLRAHRLQPAPGRG
jgi:tetratricopeptide (TPR) repeat protein